MRVGADKINREETDDQIMPNNESDMCNDNDNNDSDIQESDLVTNNEISDIKYILSEKKGHQVASSPNFYIGFIF